MQLLIVGRLAWQHETFTGLLNTFRFKDDVKMMGYIDKALLLKITGAAYALVYPSFFEGFGVPPLEAMRCHVPVLASNTSSIPEIGGDAILYFDPNDHHDIANKMIQIFKDENLRQDYISKGIERAKLYSWDRTSTLFWESIMSSIKG